MKPLSGWMRLPIALLVLILLPFFGLAVLSIGVLLIAVFAVYYYVTMWRISSRRESDVFSRDDKGVSEAQVTIIEGEFQQVDSQAVSLPEQESKQ
jgi:membrane protein implicated in regulation of membrane protease activity